MNCYCMGMYRIIRDINNKYGICGGKEMNCSFMGMYRIIRDFNNKLSVTNFKRVEVDTEFFKDLEKVFNEIADVVSHCPSIESTKKENG